MGFELVKNIIESCHYSPLCHFLAKIREKYYLQKMIKEVDQGNKKSWIISLARKIQGKPALLCLSKKMRGKPKSPSINLGDLGEKRF